MIFNLLSYFVDMTEFCIYKGGQWPWPLTIKSSNWFFLLCKFVRDGTFFSYGWMPSYLVYIYALEHDRIWHVRMKSHWSSPLTRSNDNLSSILFRAELFFWFSVAFPSYKVINITFQGHINYYLTFDMVSRAKWRGGVL